MEVLNYVFIFIAVFISSIAILEAYRGKKNKSKLNFNILEKHHIKLVSVIILIGFIIRIIYLSTNPPGLNQDEASIGYDAYSILNYGIDRNNFHNPLYLVSWGSGQNALYLYLLLPFIKIFGLSTEILRLPQAICGTMSLIVFYLLIKELWNKNIALIALILLTISPWHIMISRWALESNLLPAFLLFSTYMLVLSFKNSKIFLISMFFFGISIYAYALSYIVVPIYLFIILIYALYYKKIKLKYFTVGIIIFILLAIPLFLLILINKGMIKQIITPFFSIPLMEGYRGSEIDIKNIIPNLKTFLHILVTQSDGLVWNSIKDYGIFYLFSTPFILIGIGRSIVIAIKKVKDKQFNNELVFLVWLVASIIMISLTNTNINRENSIFIPLIYFCTLGIWFVIKNIKKALFIVFIMYLISFVSFTSYYFMYYPKKMSTVFFQSFDESISYACNETKGTIAVTNDVNMPYIYVLFTEKIPVKQFITTVIYENPTAEYRVPLKFGRFIFGYNDLYISKNQVYVINNCDRALFVKSGFKIKSFKNFSVAYFN